MPCSHTRPLKKIESNDPLWRYFDLPKFISLLDSSCLYFSTLESLGKEDPLEGQFTKPRRDLLNVEFDRLTKVQKNLFKINSPKDLDIFLMANSPHSEWNKAARQVTYVNCWNQNKCESMAMWKLYSGNSGVAIQTSVRRLTKSLRFAEQNIAIGKVEYIDDTNEDIKLFGWPWMSAFSKRNSYMDEREIRLLYFEGERFMNWVHKCLADSPFTLKNKTGINIPVDLNILIDKIYTPPRAEKWIHSMIKSILKKYGITKPVIQSKI